MERCKGRKRIAEGEMRVSKNIGGKERKSGRKKMERGWWRERDG